MVVLRNWPEEEWALLVQTKLKSKAREAYAGMNVNRCNDYQVVKETVLQTVRVDLEIYRQRFRYVKKSPSCTYLKMARECSFKFHKWLKAENVNEKEDLWQLIMLEHFRYNLKPDLRYEIMKFDI